MTEQLGGGGLISCRKLLSELSNLLDDDVDPQLRAQLEVHMKACPDCWCTYDTTRQVLLFFRGNEPYPMPEDVKERLTSALRQKIAARVRA